eukprot:TRINITY_DN5777_c0_g1_i1.p1 TRINITY_DN5777_c0_g1~~TRINITY_DN5777_c0_g1_i1.p1  ORF type:complete len:89 (-),score=11.84 TRINITY_DN5777_c0_g1_i1:90-356(-)
MSSAATLHWFSTFEKDEWNNTPSRRDGLKIGREIEMRAKMINFIESVGRRLRMLVPRCVEGDFESKEISSRRGFWVEGDVTERTFFVP